MSNYSTTNFPTKILSEEHKNILKVIDALLKEVDALQFGGEIDKDFFDQTIDFIKGYVDNFHHTKEEKILFVELCKDNVQMPCNPVQQMLHEHDLGRKYIKELKEGVVQSDRQKIIQNAREYGNLLIGHIYKEDHILYPMANQVLNPETNKIMLENFQKSDHELGKKQKKYLEFVNKLKK